MANLLKKHKGDITFACYSERGIVAHLMFRVLPVELADFLRTIKFPAGVNHPFAHVVPGALREVTIFSELDFGTEGFGKPNGAVWFRLDAVPHMLFLEGKANESYEASCKEKPAGKRKKKREFLDELAEELQQRQPEEPCPEETASTTGYNSTLRGQLELRYRAIRLYKVYHAEAVQRLKKKGRMRECLRETPAVKAFYKGKDGFYANLKRTDEGWLGSWRHLWLMDGVEEVFRYVGQTPEENILFLSFTKEKSNPFDTMDANRFAPRLFDVPNWHDAKHRFPWLSSEEVEKRWDDK